MLRSTWQPTQRLNWKLLMCSCICLTCQITTNNLFLFCQTVILDLSQTTHLGLLLHHTYFLNNMKVTFSVNDKSWTPSIPENWIRYHDLKKFQRCPYSFWRVIFQHLLHPRFWVTPLSPTVRKCWYIWSWPIKQYIKPDIRATDNGTH
jgi:hypothetical protein